ncbi:MAG: FAD-binding protein [bacterium]|nr:FAD-binding protein [bacterium]
MTRDSRGVNMADFIRAECDVLVLGGGAAGCLAALRLKELEPGLRVVLLEQAALERSGRLGPGLAVLSPCLHHDESAESFLAHLETIGRGLVEGAMVRPLLERSAEVLDRLIRLGLPVEMKDSEPARAGRWGVPCRGGDLKPLLAHGLAEAGVDTLEHVAATGLCVTGKRVAGATGFHVRSGVFHVIGARAVLLAAGATEGLYRSPLAESSPHRAAASPFNDGSGPALALRAGVELTGLEHRSQTVVLAGSRAPVEILVEEYGLPVFNARGEALPFAGADGLASAVLAAENAGLGPCRVETTGLSAGEAKRIVARYLESHPVAALGWVAEGVSPRDEPLEIALSEPAVGGLDSPGGVAVDPDRRTALTGLYAAGETAGGTSGKGVVGVFAEALLAGETIAGDLERLECAELDEEWLVSESRRVEEPLLRLSRVGDGVDPNDIEQRMRRVMDAYAGGRSAGFRVEVELLGMCRTELEKLTEQVPFLVCSSNHDAVLCLRARNRLLVARALVEHLLAHTEDCNRPILSHLNPQTGEPTINR